MSIASDIFEDYTESGDHWDEDNVYIWNVCNEQAVRVYADPYVTEYYFADGSSIRTRPIWEVAGDE